MTITKVDTKKLTMEETAQLEAAGLDLKYLDVENESDLRRLHSGDVTEDDPIAAQLRAVGIEPAYMNCATSDEARVVTKRLALQRK